MTNIEKLPSSLLQGQFLHCRPIENSKIIEAQIFNAGEELPLAERVIVCPLRAPASRCFATGELCHYWKTRYIIGPNMDNKIVNYQ
jgi:hypothetical protein